MRAVFNYLFYCFYCLTSAQNSDRAGASRSALFLFVFFALLDAYTLLVTLWGRNAHFFATGAGSAVSTQALLYFTYYRSKAYAPLVTRYAQGEPKRLRLALTGAVLLLSVMFLPFLLLKASRL
jgi:hypothetical protein